MRKMLVSDYEVGVGALLLPNNFIRLIKLAYEARVFPNRECLNISNVTTWDVLLKKEIE